MKNICPHCGTGNNVEPLMIEQSMVCVICGKEIYYKNPNLIECPDCYASISKRASKCPYCGAPTVSVQIKTNDFNVDTEKEVMILHPSCWNYFLGIVVGIITAPVIVGLFILFFIWVDYYFTSYRITDRRIVVKRGLISKYQNEIWIKDMRGANLTQGVLQRLLNIGDIHIGTAATADTEIHMNGIPEPQKVVDTINSLRK